MAAATSGRMIPPDRRVAGPLALMMGVTPRLAKMLLLNAPLPSFARHAHPPAAAR